MNTAPQAGELKDVAALVKKYNRSERVIWKFIRDAGLERFRMPGHGRTTFVRAADFDRAWKAGIPVRPQSTRVDLSPVAAG